MNTAHQLSNVSEWEIQIDYHIKEMCGICLELTKETEYINLHVTHWNLKILVSRPIVLKSPLRRGVKLPFLIQTQMV